MAKKISQKPGVLMAKSSRKSISKAKKGPKSRTRTTVRHQRKNFNLEHGSKRNNMKRKYNTKRNNSLRQKRKQHVKTRRRTKGKHEEEREEIEKM